MSNSIAPGSSADINVKVTALTTNPNVPVTYKTIILKKNLVNGVNTLTQEMMSATNTKYVIKYDYVLGSDITIPENCILEFDGGSISGNSNETITFSNTGCSDYKFSNVTLSGKYYFLNPLIVPIDNAKEFVENVLVGVDFASDKPTVFYFSANSVYSWEGILTIDKRNVTLCGGGTISGSIHLGVTDEVYTKYGLDSSYVHSQFNIHITNLRFQKLFSLNNTEISNYVNAGYITNDADIAISLTNVSNVKIDNCSFKAVPFPIVYRKGGTGHGQCVRRIFITSCDFDYVNTALYTTIPDEDTSKKAYGDTSMIGCSIFPSKSAVVLNWCDGFIFQGNTIYPGSDYGLYLNEVFECLINGNNLFGEIFCKNTIYALRVEQLNITCNMFGGSWAPWKMVTNEEELGCIYLNSSYSIIVNIENNTFDACYRIPIVNVSTDIRSLSIQGNKITDVIYSHDDMYDNYVNNVMPMYYCKTMAYQTSLQINERKENIYKGTYPNNYHAEWLPKVIKDYRCIADVSQLPNYGNTKVHSMSKTNVISVVNCNTPSSDGTLKFMFDGIDYSVDFTTSDTPLTLADKIYNEVNGRSDYNILSIGGCVYFKSIDPNKQPVCGFASYYNHMPVSQLFYNYGYRIIFRGLDGKKEISSIYQKGLTYKDNGIILSNDENIYVFEAAKMSDTTKQSITFPSTITNIATHGIITNDCCIALHTGPGVNVKGIVDSIINFCYSDVFTSSDGTITYIEPNTCELIKNVSLDTLALLTIPDIFWYGWKRAHISFKDYDFYGSARPSFNQNQEIGYQFFDTSLRKPIYWTGSGWIDATGASV